MSDDMTFCSNNKCGRLRCERNPKRIKVHYIPHSFMELDGTEYCYKVINKVGKMKNADRKRS